jgi:hypothetical protein
VGATENFGQVGKKVDRGGGRRRLFEGLIGLLFLRQRGRGGEGQYGGEQCGAKHHGLHASVPGKRMQKGAAGLPFAPQSA